MNRLVLVIAATLVGWPTLAAQTAPNACGLLTDAEVAQLITRGKQTYGQTADATPVVGGQGSVCDYPAGGQVSLYVGPNSTQAFEQFMKVWKQENETRHPVSGVGDKAYVFYPKPRNSESDQGPYLVATVGPHTVTAFLAAEKSQAAGLMATVCRDDKSRAELTPKEQEECKKILADKGESPESLQPAVVELAKAVVAKVRSGKLGQ